MPSGPERQPLGQVSSLIDDPARLRRLVSRTSTARASVIAGGGADAQCALAVPNVNRSGKCHRSSSRSPVCPRSRAGRPERQPLGQVPSTAPNINCSASCLLQSITIQLSSCGPTAGHAGARDWTIARQALSVNSSGKCCHREPAPEVEVVVASSPSPLDDPEPAP
jgi:hypothetical protein